VSASYIFLNLNKMNQTKQYNIIISFLVIIFLGVIVIIYKQHKPNLEGFKGPSTHCDQTSLTYDQGARCTGSDYRKTKDWCCSDYGKSKGYKWDAPLDADYYKRKREYINNMNGGSNVNMNAGSNVF
jgi:hypothetical protein